MTDVRQSAPAEPRVIAEPPPLGPRVRLRQAIAAVASGQLARVRVARGPLLFVATVQSLGLVILLRGVVHRHDATTASAVVAGSTILVVAFVALNLMAQWLGGLRASHALDYYAAMPISPAAVVLGIAASYAGFAVPGALLTTVVGVAVYGLHFSAAWVALPAVAVAALALAGAGAVIGLGLPRAELATVAGQLGMTAVLFLGIIAPSHLPEVVRGIRTLVPGTLAADALADALRPRPDWFGIWVRLLASAGYGAIALGVAGRAFRRAVDR